MVKSELTKEMVEAGHRFLDLLDRAAFPVKACFWMYFEESGRWRFVVASAFVRERGPFAAYRKLGSFAGKIEGGTAVFTAGALTALSDDDPVAKAVRRLAGPKRRPDGLRVSNRFAEGAYIDDAFIYRAA